LKSIFCYNESSPGTNNDDLNTFLNEYFINDKPAILNRPTTPATDHDPPKACKTHLVCLIADDSYFADYDSQAFPSINLFCSNNRVYNLAIGLRSRKRAAYMAPIHLSIPQALCTNPNKYCKQKVADQDESKLHTSPKTPERHAFKIHKTKRRNTIDAAPATHTRPYGGERSSKASKCLRK
jgi:hypothetical protein